MIKAVETQLLFIGSAEEAMMSYVDALGGEVRLLERYPEEHPLQAGQIFRAVFTIGSQRFACIDSADAHDFSFTPSMSIVLEMSSEAELREKYELLAAGGKILMPLDNYGFSDLFVWFNDRFGVSWQLNYINDVA